MFRRSLRQLAFVLAAGSLAAGACSDDEPALSVDELRDSTDACPVDIETALGDAGVDGGTVEVEVEEGTGATGDDASALDRAGGVYVSCEWYPDGSDSDEEDSDGEAQDDGDGVAVELITAEEGDAALLFLPAVQAGAGIDSDEARALADRIVDTDDRDRVDLGDDATAALAPVDVEGASSGALFVSGESLTAEQVATITDALLDEL